MRYYEDGNCPIFLIDSNIFKHRLQKPHEKKEDLEAVKKLWEYYLQNENLQFYITNSILGELYEPNNRKYISNEEEKRKKGLPVRGNDGDMEKKLWNPNRE